MGKKVQGIFYLIFNIHRVFLSAKLMKERRFDEMITRSKKWVEKKDNDFIALRNLAFANVYKGNSDAGFEYMKILLPNIYSNTLIEKVLAFFVYPEIKNHNYEKALYRCSYFLYEGLSEKDTEKIKNIVEKIKKKQAEGVK